MKESYSDPHHSAPVPYDPASHKKYQLGISPSDFTVGGTIEFTDHRPKDRGRKRPKNEKR
jgi:hypothetical protein